MAAYGNITAEELKDRLDEVMLVDVSSPAETDRGIIEGAILIPLHLVPLSVDRFRGDKYVVIYCLSGARSAQACRYLAGQGLDRLFNLQGGIMHWVGSGLPLVVPES